MEHEGDPAAGQEPEDRGRKVASSLTARPEAADLERLNALLRRAVREVSRAADVREALSTALRVVCEGDGWSCGEAWTPAGEDGELAQAVDAYTKGDRMARFADAGRQLTFAPGQGLPGLCWAAGRPLVFKDVAMERVERFRRRELARLFGLHTALAVPADGLDGRCAVLVFMARGVRPIAPATAETIAAVGSLVGAVIERLEGKTDTRLARQRQAVLADIVALGQRGESLDRLLEEALRLVLQLPGLAVQPAGCIFLADETGANLRLAAESGIPEAVKRSCAEVPLGSCLCGSAAAEGATVTAADVDERHTTSYDGMTQHGHYCLPLCAGDKTLGVLRLHTDPGHTPGPEEEAVLESAARAVASLILRTRLVQDLAISRANFTGLVRHAPMGVLIVGTDGGVRYANESAERLLGLEPGGAEGIRIDDYLERRGEEAVLTRGGRASLLLRLARSELVWGGEPAEMIAIGDITAERAMEKMRRTVAGGHYPDIARSVFEHGATRYPPEEKDVSVLFIDMKGSTSVAATRGLAELAKVLDALYRLAIEAIDACGGSVNNFIGDAVMATFNAPLDLPDHPWQAVEAGSRFLTLLAAHSAEHPDAAFDVRMGVETGPALVGDIGPEERHLYTITAACAQFASRLTKLPLENRVVVGPAVARALAGRVPLVSLGATAIEGLEARREVFVLGEEEGDGEEPGV